MACVRMMPYGSARAYFSFTTVANREVYLVNSHILSVSAVVSAVVNTVSAITQLRRNPPPPPRARPLPPIISPIQVAEEATGQGHPATAVQRAIAIMAVRGELQEKNRGFLLYRMR